MKVAKGQDPYNVIGNYIREHLTVIEDMIAVIRINDSITNELFLVDWGEEGCFVWHHDWWEGEENVELIDFFPVSDSERLPEPENMCVNLDIQKIATHKSDFSDLDELPSAQSEHLVKESGNLVNGLVNDCISRQAAIDAIDRAVTKEAARWSLQELPSAERRGRWEFNIDDKGWSWDKPYMCDQCGEWVEKVFKFCPSCGAKMEGGQNE